MAAGERARSEAVARAGAAKGPAGGSAKEPPRAPSGREARFALAAVLLVALAIRVWKVGYALPQFLDEALPLRWALAMWSDPAGRIDWNPHRFHHPSLPTYLHLLAQQAEYLAGRIAGGYRNAADYHIGFMVDPSLVVLAGRGIGVAADLATVLIAGLIGERIRRGAGWLAALLVACSPTFVVAARSICSDSVMIPFATAAMERMLAYRERGGRVRLVAAAVLIGLAAGSKYPAAFLLVPLGAALWLRGGARELRLWAQAAVIAGLVFVATTPFAALDFATFWRDLGYLQGLAEKGHFGNLSRSGFLFHLRNLARDISWVGIAGLAGSLGWTALRARARPGAMLVWLGLLAFGIPIALARIEAERYLLPVLPLASVLVAELAFAATDRLPRRMRPAVLAVAALVLAGPALVTAARDVIASDADTRIAARRWCETHLTHQHLVVQEFYCAPLIYRMDWVVVREGAMYGAASPAVQRRYDALAWFPGATLPLVVAGNSVNSVTPPAGRPVTLDVFPRAADSNAPVYDPQLLVGVDYFATSSAVRERFEADTARYVLEHRFYDLLETTAQVVARFRPRGPNGGPEIVFYRLATNAQDAFRSYGPLNPLWWAETIPPPYRAQAEQVLQPQHPSGGATQLPDGSPAAWVLSLRPYYDYLLADFVTVMRTELADRGRYPEARRLATATLMLEPDDVPACLIFVFCSDRMGELDAARAALERSLHALDARGQSAPILRLRHGEVLFKLGDRDGARREFEAVAAAGGETSQRARSWLEGMR